MLLLQSKVSIESISKRKKGGIFIFGVVVVDEILIKDCGKRRVTGSENREVEKTLSALQF